MTSFLASIHDVMPETLSKVDEIVRVMSRSGWPPATLLVVPGRDWSAEELGRLRTYADRGHQLAAHGWSHRIRRIRNIRHLAHSVLISRRVAEHYTLDSLGVDVLVRRSRHWFRQNDLPEPVLYVPPAWALGPVSPTRLARQGGFRFVETLRGVHDAGEGIFFQLPVLGFEADTAFRAAFLRASNAANLRFAERVGAARVAIHPDDLELRLADDLRALIALAPATVQLEGLGASQATGYVT